MGAPSGAPILVSSEIMVLLIVVIDRLVVVIVWLVAIVGLVVAKRKTL